MGVVLIAEDEPPMLEICADIVEDLGHRTLRAHDGEEALLLARTERPDLVISDHMMPRRTGVQLLRALRSDPELAAIPFLLLSSARPQGLEEADAFLPKPVDVGTFEMTVQKVLGPSRDAPNRRERRRREPSRVNDAIREEMLNWLAHEIKAPLSTARMSAQLLERRLDKGEASQPEKKLSATIIRQLDRIHALSTSTLDAAPLTDRRVARRMTRGSPHAAPRRHHSGTLRARKGFHVHIAPAHGALDHHGHGPIDGALGALEPRTTSKPVPRAAHGVRSRAQGRALERPGSTPFDVQNSTLDASENQVPGLERETGVEPATLSLGMRTGSSAASRTGWQTSEERTIGDPNPDARSRGFAGFCTREA